MKHISILTISDVKGASRLPIRPTDNEMPIAWLLNE